MTRLLQYGLVSILLMSLSLTAAHGGDPTVEAIEYRQATMEVIMWHFKPMRAMVQGKIPFDGQSFAKKAQNLAALSRLPLEGFILGSDKGETDAKPEIWQYWGDFQAKMAKFEEESAKLAEVAKTAATMVGQIAAQFGNMAETCKGCHDNYRK